MYLPEIQSPKNTLYKLIKNNFNNINAHPNWFYIHQLNEAAHFFEPDKHSIYRQDIDSIVSQIIQHKFTKKVNLLSNNNKLFEKYIFLNPFKHIKQLNIISCLQIYVSYTNNIDNEDAYCICGTYNIQNEYNPEEWPLYKSEGTTIQLMSIVLNIFHGNKDNIISLISHELRHALDFIGNKKLLYNSDNENGLRDIIAAEQQLLCNQLSNDDFKLYGYAANCCYYTQTTEINAHIETVINDFKYFKYSKEDILLLCKYPSLCIDQVIDEVIQKYGKGILYKFNYPNMTLGTYVTLYEMTKNYLKSYSYDSKDMKNILTLYNTNCNTQFNNFKDLLQYWYKQFQIFFNHLSKICYLEFDKIF